MLFTYNNTFLAENVYSLSLQRNKSNNNISVSLAKWLSVCLMNEVAIGLSPLAVT